MPRTALRVRRWAAIAVLGGLLAGCGTENADPDPGEPAAAAGAGARTRYGGAAHRGRHPDHRRQGRHGLAAEAAGEDRLPGRPLRRHPRRAGHDSHRHQLPGARAPEVPGQGEGGEGSGRARRLLSPEVEAILSHKPDLVIGLEDTHGKLAPALKGATAFWPVQPGSWQDSVGYLRDLAALTGRTAQGEEAERTFRTRLAEAEKQKSDRTALIIYGSDENFGVATPETDVAAGLFPKISHYPWKSRGIDGSYSLEEILARDVDVLFVETLSFGAPDGKLSDKLAKNPLWSRIPAVKNGKVIEVDSEVWAKGRGTRSLGLVLDEATAALR